MEIAAVRVSSEIIGFERGKQLEQERMNNLTQSFKDLKKIMEKQHEDDMDALSEEAVKVTNRLKGKLTGTEQKNVQIEGQYSQLLAVKEKNDNDTKLMKLRIIELERTLIVREDASKVLLAETTATVLQAANDSKFQSESSRQKLLLELDCIKKSMEEKQKSSETSNREKEIFFSNKQYDLESQIEVLQNQTDEMKIIHKKLQNELVGKEKSYKALEGDSVNRKESSSLIQDLTQSLQRSLQEKNVLLDDMKNLRKDKVFKVFFSLILIYILSIFILYLGKAVSLSLSRSLSFSFSFSFLLSLFLSFFFTNFLSLLLLFHPSMLSFHLILFTQHYLISRFFKKILLQALREGLRT